jgi:hypothetical protein
MHNLSPLEALFDTKEDSREELLRDLSLGMKQLIREAAECALLSVHGAGDDQQRGATLTQDSEEKDALMDLFRSRSCPDPPPKLYTLCIQSLLLLREHVPSNDVWVTTVACLFRPVPVLLDTFCQVFPEQLSTAGPLHGALWYQQHCHPLQREQMLRTLVRADPEALQVPFPSTQLTGTTCRCLRGLHPVMVAAVLDYSLDVLFEMLVKCPQVLSKVS